MTIIKDKFKDRKYYDDNIVTIPEQELSTTYTKYFLDSWNIFPLYGKVDTLGIPIIPKRTFIDYCSYAKDKKQVLVTYPAKTFFRSFREQYLDYYSFGAINKNSNFFKQDINPVNGYIEVDLGYKSKLEDLFSNFCVHEKSNNKSRLSKLWGTNSTNKIKNFNDFINEFLNFLSYKEFYFTRAGYVESTDYSLLHTGLVVDIFDGDPNDDDLRRSFALDPNFNAYKELCLRNNLKIDREIPWRIYVDIRTKKNNFNNDIPYGQLDFETSIKQYLPYFKKLQDFFDFFYVRAIPYDEVSFVYFEEFIQMIESFYEHYVRGFPSYRLYDVNFCGNAKVNKKNRDKISIVTNADYLELYFKIRNIELSKIIKDVNLEQISLQSLDIFKQYQENIGFRKAIILAVKNYTNNVGTLSYNNLSLYELDEKSKMP